MTFSRPTNLDLSARVTAALTPEQGRILRSIANEADRQHLPLYIVGGFVRDLLLGHPGLDFDLVVEGDAITLAKALAAQHGGRVTAHVRFGTAQWFRPDSEIQTLDLISTRSESYKRPAALPTVKPGMLGDDLRRRDFTINTLALRLNGNHFGELRDDLGGLEDLQAGVVRVLHPASFEDDPTRLFRVVRYEQRYGFKIAHETRMLIPSACQLIKNLSAERVRHELDLIMDEENSAAILKRLMELGILTAVHPALEWDSATQTRFVNGLASAKTLVHPLSRRVLGWTLWLMDVPLPALESIEKRLHFEAGLRDVLLAASALFADTNTFADKKVSVCVTVLDEIPLKAVEAVLLALPAGLARQKLRDYLETWRHVKPRTTGHMLIKRGIPPGPIYKSILRRLREAWLDGKVKTIEDEMVLLEKLTKKTSSM
jgi:tRNA nucleotidyltransferase (CCA-adding enzyme)